ncbi:MAG: hypothetical protein MUP62_05425, partial [Dehalococcoidia bacterium]|nr:hypothetical protein [Dehalococcoidia bacterium]
HDADSSQRIFQIVHLFQQRLPEEEKREIGKPRILNRREIYWPKINSRIFVGTAGSLTFGRGQTITNLLCSELAYWPRPQEALIALTEAVAPGGRVVIESTANGMGGYFHELWLEAKAGEGRYRPHFYPWVWDSQYRLTGPALEGITGEESQLMSAHGLDDDQTRWRRAKRRELRDRFPQEYPEDDVTCFLASGRCVFDIASLTAMQQRIAAEPPPAEVASLTSKNGTISVAPARLLIWQSPLPKRRYLIGADPSGGGAYGDASAAVVLDYEAGEQVAVMHGRVLPERFAQVLDVLGRYYNYAELAVERNNHGHSTLNTLFHSCGYSNLYRHADYNNPQDRHGQLGWLTDSKTKPLMVDGLAAAIAEGAIGIHCSQTIEECFSYIVTDSGGTEAQPGHHDDLVVATAIAWQLRQRPKPMIQIAKVGAPSPKMRATPRQGLPEPPVREFMGQRYRIIDSMSRVQYYYKGRPWPY